MIKIGIFTSTRAEYGLLRELMHRIEKADQLELLLYAGGTHILNEFGYTKKYILEDGFKISEEFDFLLASGTALGVCKSNALVQLSFAEIFQRNRPNLLIVLGDRSETLSVCFAATLFGIKIAHIHGGEITEGAIDDAMRHAITKLATLHFTSTEEYRRRVIQLGEQPDKVFNVGAPGVDNIMSMEIIGLEEITESMRFAVEEKKFFLFTYHPVTLDDDAGILELRNALNAMLSFSEFKVLISYPNADSASAEIREILSQFEQNNRKRIKLVKSFGQKNYLNLMKYSALVIGNSSSGIIEAPSVGVPSLNIGNRQKGRVTAKSTISVGSSYEEIEQGIKICLSREFTNKAKSASNPYGNGTAIDGIFKVLEDFNYSGSPKKTFFDLE